MVVKYVQLQEQFAPRVVNLFVLVRACAPEEVQGTCARHCRVKSGVEGVEGRRVKGGVQTLETFREEGEGRGPASPPKPRLWLKALYC